MKITIFGHQYLLKNKSKTRPALNEYREVKILLSKGKLFNFSVTASKQIASFTNNKNRQANKVNISAVCM